MSQYHEDGLFAALLHTAENNPIYIATTALVLISVVTISQLVQNARVHRPWPDFPLVALDEEGLSAKESWLYRARDTIHKGLRLHPDGFQVMQSSGPRIILPNRFAEEIKKVPQWTFFGWIAREFFTSYPEFQAFGAGHGPLDMNTLLIDTTRIKITQSLNSVTEDLSEEATEVIDELFGSSKNWTSVNVKDSATKLVARMSARVFGGKEVASNKEWVKIAGTHAIHAIAATKEMRASNSLLLPITHWFKPYCTQVRAEIKKARSIIEPVVAARTAAHNAIIAAGKKPPKLYDATSWALELAKGRPVDVTTFQLQLTNVAIPTTSELTAYAMLDIAEHPELFPALREEIIDVIGSQGWAKTALSNLKVMDSFLKESQRFHPTQWSVMRRVAGTPLTLSTGKKIPKGAAISVSMEYMNSAKYYADPEKFDAYRFLRMRQQSGEENQHQFATITPEHLGWGYGEHACPGRFFAVNEVKIALCHLLLKYDWRLPASYGGKMRPDHVFETQPSCNHANELEIKRREEEISL